MPITFVPDAGDVLMCDFTGLAASEMTKLRKVVILSPRSRVSFPGTFLVVPLSKTPSASPEPCHCEFRRRSYEFLDPVESVWAKAGMLTCVASARLDRLKFNGRFSAARIRREDLLRVRVAVLHALGMQEWKQVEAAVNNTLGRIARP